MRLYPKLLALVMVHGSAGCLGGKVCTEVGCRDQASITVLRSDGATPPMAVLLEVDGRRVTCPAPEAKSAGGTACDDRQVRVQHREEVDCTETRTATAVSESCVRNGRLAQVISIAGAPQRVVATVMADTTVVGQRTFDLTYAEVRPNGEGCEPVCRQRAETWELP